MSRPLVIAALAAAGALAVFGPAIRYDFVGWDDDIHVYNNPYVVCPSLAGLLRLWKTPHEGIYIPLTFSVWAAIARFSQPAAACPLRLTPPVFHAANLLFHVAAVLTVFNLFRLLLSPGGGRADPPRVLWSAGAGALLFAVHPLQVEPVVWVSSLKDILCGFFSALALLGYIKVAGYGDPPPGSCPGEDKRRKKWLMIGGTAAFVLALFAKPASVVVPVIAFLLYLFPSGSSGVPDRAPSSRMLALSAVWLALALPIMFMAKFAERDIPLGFVAPFWARPLLALDAIAFYLEKLLIPAGLGIDYGRTPAWVLSRGYCFYTWIFPLAAALALSFLKDRWKFLLPFGVFVVGALPTLGLVPHGYQVFSTVADRFLYLAMIGPALAFSWLIFSRRNRISAVLGAALLFLWGGLSVVQRRQWVDNATLFTHALRVSDRSYMSHYNLGITLADGDRKEAAVAHYEAALRIKPDYGRARNNLGALLDVMGRHREAVVQYRETLRQTPGDVKLYYNLGHALASLGRTEEAIACYREALRLRPDYAEVHNNLGLALAGQGRLDEAIVHYREAVRINPGSFMAYNNLGIALADRGDLGGAIEQYLSALKVNPAYAEAHSNLGNALMDAGRANEAIAHYREAIRLNPGYAMAYNNLGAAFARQGKIGEAREWFLKALQIDPNLANARVNLSRLGQEGEE